MNWKQQKYQRNWSLFSSLSQYHTFFAFFFRLINCRENKAQQYKQVSWMTKIVWLKTCTIRNYAQGMKKSGGLGCSFYHLVALTSDLSANRTPNKMSSTTVIKYKMICLSFGFKLIVNTLFTGQMTNSYCREYCTSCFIPKAIIMFLVWNNYCRIHN